MSSEPKKKGGWLGKLIFWLVLVVIGLGIGISPVGDILRSVYYPLRYLKNPVAKGFLPKPFALRIEFTTNQQGELEVYLVNETKHEALPIYEVEGTTQVGDVEHRVKGISEETRTKIIELLEGAKEGSSTTLDKVKKLLEGLGK